MGGQACVLYGAAEFSRDLDLAVDDSPSNLRALSKALEELEAERVAVPPFKGEHLHRGLAIHFRCRRPDVKGLRIDVMAVMRGVDPFTTLWERRTTLDVQGLEVDLLALPDLVQAKKTQRDKDWPMILRLVEAHYFQNRDDPSRKQVEFWLREARTPTVLLEVARSHPDICRTVQVQRPLLSQALERDESALRQALRLEEWRERERDTLYWRPLKKELERLRHQREE